jgi:hypothetical protein
MAATAESPIQNLCLVIKNWGPSPASILLNGKPVPPEDVKLGMLGSLEGNDLVVWLSLKSTEKTIISVK